MDERGRRRLAVGAGDADDLVRRKLGPGAGEQLDVADDLDAGVARPLRNRMAVEREAGCDDEAVELRQVGLVEVDDRRSRRRAKPRLCFSSHAATSAPLPSSAVTVALPERANP